MVLILGCAALCLFVCLPLYLHYKPVKLSLAVCHKSLGTLCALVPALVAALRLDNMYWFFVAAIFIHAVADWLLEYWFGVGLGCFFLGHLCYISVFLKLFPVTLNHLIILLILLLTFGFLLKKYWKIIEKNRTLFVVYAVTLSVMTACGLGGISSYSIKGMMIGVGASLFCFSDSLIFLRLVSSPGSTRKDLLILFTYYAAQLLLGGSCLF